MIVYPVFDHDEVSEDFLVGVFSTVEKAQTYLDDNQGACGGTLFIVTLSASMTWRVSISQRL